ncbi:NHLP bacteriocin export ABC transporter permease/ATPase subunit [Streptosporangium longisporum]|uniref:NHLP bacteriocin export ABC transporter permease/ATPase subunit n=1 Tax=Streptosporangium longisporum TaxID=46187 RepID=A0ABN3XZF0_9ACTN
MIPAELLPVTTRVDLGTERFMILDDPRLLLLVEAGAVDLFAVRTAGGELEGRWNFLGRAESGTVLAWGVRSGPRHVIVARPVPGAVLSDVLVTQLGGLPADAIDWLMKGLGHGVELLAGALPGTLPPRQFVPLPADGTAELDADATVRSVDGVLCVRVEAGELEIGDSDGVLLGAGDDVCLTEGEWLVARTGTRLRARTLRSVSGEGDGALGELLTAHAVRLLTRIDARIDRQRDEERAALAALSERDGTVLTQAVRSFDAVLRDTDSPVRVADVAADPPSLASARLVGAHLGFDVRPPVRHGGQGRTVDDLQAIALASGVRTRVVRLEGKWWTKDLGPMVGTHSTGRHVALLPLSHGYVMVDDGVVTPVTAVVARNVTERAHVLYRPLPASVRSVGALLRLGLFSGNRGDLLRFAAMGVLVALLGLIVPIMTGQVLGVFTVRAEVDLIVHGSLVVIASGVVIAALSVVQNIAVLRIESRSTSAMQSGLWTRLLSLPAGFFTRYSTGELGTTVLGISSAQEMLSGMLTTATLGLLTGSANLVLVFFYDVRLALIAMALTLCGVGFALGAGRAQLRWQREAYRHEQTLSARVFQMLTAMPKLRAAAAEERAFAEWTREVTRGRTLIASARRVQNVVTTFNAGFPLVCTAIVFAVVAGPLKGEVPIAAFLPFFTAFSLLLASSLQFTAAAVTAMGVVPMMENIKPILEARPETDGTKADPGDLSGRLALSRVSFRYGTDGPLTLDGVALSIEPGEFVALVGPSGSGKSTVLRLLLGFETPLSGTVLYDGQDLAELDVSAVRRQCGVVLQNGALQAGSIQANIIGSSTYTIDDAWAAAEMAGLAADIKAMPMGMHTVLSEGTTTFSGGQRQRIMIARALIARPRIVFFDEATSALDNPTQSVVAESTHRLNATRVVIAHRLSTVVDADRIVVMDEGRIVQQGTYEELLAVPDGLFARLATRQLC